MSDTKMKMGTIGWVDLTVPNASEVRDFYEAVVGWSTTETAIGGVCHARGTNAGLPASGSYT